MATVDLTRIGSNIAALNALNSLKNVNADLATHQQRLSTGKKINSAGDSPASLTLSTQLNVQDQSLQQANSNISDAQNLLSVAEGGLNSMNSILSNMRVMAEQAASGTLNSTQIGAIDGQLQQYTAEIDDIANQTTWNQQSLLSGALANTGVTFQTGTGQTNATTWSLGQSFLSSQTGGAGLGLATVAGSSSAATLPSMAPTIASASTVAATGSTMATSGTYTVQLNLGTVGANNTVSDSTVTVLDSNGKAINLFTAAGVTVTSLSFAYDTSAASVNLGNGVLLTLETTLTTDSFTGQISFTAAGTYKTGLGGATQTYNNANATTYMNTIDTAIATVSAALANIGAMEDRLNYKSQNLTTSDTNVQSSYNQIMNADMASEQVAVTKDQILQSTATSMLASANSAPQSILKLFQ